MTTKEEPLVGLKGSVEKIIEAYKRAKADIASLEAAFNSQYEEITELMAKASSDRAVIEALTASIDSSVEEPVDPGASMGGISA